MGSKRVWLNYNPCDLVCTVHNIKFTRFSFRVSDQYNTFSHGCPVCVRLIRQDVQKSLDSGTKIGKHGYRVRTSVERKPYAKRSKKIDVFEGIASTGVKIRGT